MKKNRPKITINVKNSNENQNTFLVSDSGTFREGDIAIGKKGLLVSGKSPQATPEAKSNLLFGQSPPINAPGLERRDSNSSNSPPVASPTSNSYGNISSPGSSLTSGNALELVDLEFLAGKEGVIGSGSSGLVKLAKHKPSGAILAVKIIQLEVEENVRKQIILELKTLHRSQCEYVVSFYDAFFNEGNIYVALEYMDAGSLATVLSKSGPVPENVIAKIAIQVLQGLNYLHKKLHLIHRDIKPSNLLINNAGDVKISDFGVSGQLAHTLSKKQSWVGTVTYMSPERITGSSYSYDSDIWSLGLTLVECALGRFPYDVNDDKRASSFGFWELMEFIVKQPPPSLPSGKFSREFCSFVEKCLQKSPEERPSAFTLLNDPWIKKYSNDNLNLAEWLSQWKDKK